MILNSSLSLDGNLYSLSNDAFKFTSNRMQQVEIQRFLPTLILLTIVLCIVGLVGGIGNALVIYAFYLLPKLRSTGGKGGSAALNFRGVSNLFIIVLAGIDIVICLVDIPATLYWVVWQRDTIDVICKLHVTVKAFFIHISALILVLIAVDRFLLICFVPGIQMKRRMVMLALLVISLVGLALAIPMGLHNGIVKIKIEPFDFMMSPRGFNGSNDPRGLHGIVPNQMKHTYFDQKDAFNYSNYETNVGQCQVDKRYITDTQYHYYQTTMFVVFIIMFVVITVLYTLIFTFVWWRQHLRDKRYGVPKSSLPKQDDKPLVTSTVKNNPNCELQHELNVNEHEINLDSTIMSYEPSTKIEMIKNGDHQNEVELEEETVIDRSSRKSHPNRFQLYRMSRKRQASEQQSGCRRPKPHIRTAQTLGLITVTFIASYMPHMLIINNIIFPHQMTYKAGNAAVSQHLRRFFFYLYFLNSAANPIIYSCMNKKFRSEMATLLQRFKNLFIR